MKKTFKATFEQIRSWPVNENGWYVDPETGLRANVGSRRGADYPITAGNYFKAGWGFTAADNFTAGHFFCAGNRFDVGDDFMAGNNFTAGDRFTTGDNFTVKDRAVTDGVNYQPKIKTYDDLLEAMDESSSDDHWYLVNKHHIRKYGEYKENKEFERISKKLMGVIKQ